MEVQTIFCSVTNFHDGGNPLNFLPRRIILSRIRGASVASDSIHVALTQEDVKHPHPNVVWPLIISSSTSTPLLVIAVNGQGFIIDDDVIRSTIFHNLIIDLRVVLRTTTIIIPFELTVMIKVELIQI